MVSVILNTNVTYRHLKIPISHSVHISVRVEESSSKVFFSQPAQKLMKEVTGFDLEKINRARTRPGQVKAPLLKFMTTEMLERVSTFFSNFHIYIAF